ncbi:MAG: hypothetical protein ACLQVG_31620 [Terriglobia bacterium]
MADELVSPFSSRNRGAHAQIDEDFPESARIGLLHILRAGLEKQYLAGWRDVALELQRIAREVPASYDPSSQSDRTAQSDAIDLLMKLPWERAYDFCERLHGHLAQEAVYPCTYDNQEAVVVARSDVQLFFSSELERLFLEENLAFEFSDGLVRRRGRRHTVDRVSRAEVVLGDVRLAGARKHFSKALRYFRSVTDPDPENAVKEAVCAVEAAGKVLFPEAKGATLDDLIKWLEGNEAGEVPKAIGRTFTGLYGFRNGGDGVAHGGASGGPATPAIAEYALAVAASQIILLVDLASLQEGEIPF